MAIYAERHQVKIDGTTAYAEKHMTTHGLRKIHKIVVRIDFCKDIASDFRERLEYAALSCPVAKVRFSALQSLADET